MKVKELLEQITDNVKEYGEDFLEWEVYTEQLTPYDRRMKKKGNWGVVTDSDEWEYFRCAGYWTSMPKERIFTVNVNY